MSQNKIINSTNIIRLLLKGYTYNSAKKYLKLKNNTDLNLANGKYSLEEMFSILPFNFKFDRMFNDKVSMRLLLDYYGGIVPKQYIFITKRDGKRFLCPLKDFQGSGSSDTWIHDLISEKKSVTVVTNKMTTNNNSKFCLSYDDGNWGINEKTVTEEKMNEFINQIPVNSIVMETVISEYSFNICVINNDGNHPEIAEIYGDVTCITDETRNIALAVAGDFPEVEYLNISFACNGSEYKITNIDTGFDLLYREIHSPKITDFIDSKLSSPKYKFKVGNVSSIMKKYAFAMKAKKQGFEPFMYKNWLRGVKSDDTYENATDEEKKWCHERGFYAYRIQQYGINESNYKSFLSDYDYKRLRHINGEHRCLVDDKICFGYTFRNDKKYMLENYFHVICEDNKTKFIKCDECPKDISADEEGIISLLERKTILALKPVSASHGEGFNKLQCIDGTFYINDKEISKSELAEFFKVYDMNYIVTEYVQMNQDLKKIYPKVACTIRLMVINRNGNDPVIENAYYRIGSSNTGQTDNLSGGGICVSIDMETGRMYNSELIKNHVFITCPCHPDTNELIEGRIMPNWQEIKSKIIELSSFVSTLEYLGYDVVVTDDGFKILEVNTHQDLHKYPMYSDSIKDFLWHKLQVKDMKQNKN